MKPQSVIDASLVPSKFAMNEYSRSTISKVKPKIRIIHIVAPEIIKTDVGNFRELVQRLTGKPLQRNEILANNASSSLVSSSSPKRPHYSSKQGRNNINMGSEQGVLMLQDNDQRMMIKNEVYGEGENNPNAFLSFLGDVEDGFVHPYLNEFPLRPTSQMMINNAFGEVNFC